MGSMFVVFYVRCCASSVLYGSLCMSCYVYVVPSIQCCVYSLLCVLYFMSVVLCLGVCCYICVFVLSDLLVLFFVWFVLFFDTVCSMRKMGVAFRGFKRVCI